MRDQKRKFYNMMIKVCQELDEATGIITRSGTPDRPLQVLDLCLAPGGFSKGTLTLRPKAQIKGITISDKDGGHTVMLQPADGVRIVYADITMFSAEYGMPNSTIPENHPDKGKFSDFRPFGVSRFDLVFCDAQVLRTQDRGEHRGPEIEKIRIRAAQIVMALQRVKVGGNMLILLQHGETPDSIDIIRDISDISGEIEFWKPKNTWAVKSTFYLIARNVNPTTLMAQSIIKKYQALWQLATLHGVAPQKTEKEVEVIMKAFGERLVKMSETIWKIQLDALEKSSFIRGEEEDMTRVLRKKVADANLGC